MAAPPLFRPRLLALRRAERVRSAATSTPPPMAHTPFQQALRAMPSEAAPADHRPATLPHVRREHPYVGAALLALLLAGLAAAAWLRGGALADAAAQGSTWIAEHESARSRTTAAILLGTAGALTLVIAWGRATAERRPVRLAGGRGTMPVDAVERALAGALETRDDVATAAVRVRNRHRRGLAIAVDLDVRSHARIEDALDAVDATAHELVQVRMGARLAERPDVVVRYDELDLKAGRIDDRGRRDRSGQD